MKKKLDSGWMMLVEPHPGDRLVHILDFKAKTESIYSVEFEVILLRVKYSFATRKTLLQH